MEINIIAFGQIAEITGQSNWIMTDVASTDALLETLAASYPALKDLPYKLAVDKKMVAQNTPLSHQMTVALLPAFSGG